MSSIILISGSPSEYSRTNIVLDFIESSLRHHGYAVDRIAVTDIPAEDLLYGQYESEKMRQATKRIEKAEGVVIASPVYKAGYTGVLKAFLDLLPQDILKHKVALPIMTGGSPNHLLALEYTLKPIISILKGHSLDGVYIIDHQIDKASPYPINDIEISKRMDQQLGFFIEALQEKSITVLQ